MTMQQFISCLVSFEWLEPHPTDRKKLIPSNTSHSNLCQVYDSVVE